MHQVYYYDDYRFLSLTGFNNANFPSNIVLYKGLPTGSATTVLDSSTKLYSAAYYDARGRVISEVSSNRMGGYDKTTTTYTFTGKPKTVQTVHTATGKTTQTQLYTYTYDHAERLKTLTHKLNTGSAVTLVNNTYDNLGRLQKNSRNGTASLADNYVYNVRSWITKISGTQFTEDLTYKYNGNIATMQWLTNGQTRKYTYTYDPLSRLTAAAYTGATTAEKYNTSYTYDKHGNIKTLKRYGKTTASAYGLVDNLTMTYAGNQLTNVADAGTTVSLAESNDFKKGSTTNPGYAYNKNGEMTKDLNKKILSISYNSVSLPKSLVINGATHTYTYAADGRKLRVVQGSTNRDYAGSIIYENGSLKRILIDGGYIEGGVYYFNLNDHLGNVRTVANASGTAIQRDHYYPFGLPMAVTTSAEQDKQPYKYNGKEFERKDGLNLYDYHARQMDPGTGRFTTMDPKAEKYYGVSPYAYCNNNPMRFIDPTGMFYGDPLIPPFQRRSYQGNIFSKAYSFAYNTGASITNIPINVVNSLVDETKFIAKNGAGAYLSSAGNSISNAVESEINYRTGTPISQQASDLASEFANPQTWENVAAGAIMMAVPVKGTGVKTGGSKTTTSQGSKVIQGAKDSFTVTPQGVALPKGVEIPKGYIENFKRPGSYGTMENGKFIEKLRIDPATKPGSKGPNNSHFHIDNKRKHETDLNKWPK